MYNSGKALLIDHNPYAFVYSIRDDPSGNFYSFGVYESYAKITLPYPDGLQFEIDDRNRLSYNLSQVAVQQLSRANLTANFVWAALEDEFKQSLLKILKAPRLKMRVSLDDGETYVVGEPDTQIKQENFTGHNEIHLQKVQLGFRTELTPFTFDELFGKTPVEVALVSEDELYVISTEDSEPLGID